MKMFAAVLFVIIGSALLLELRHPYESRQARWGKRGQGPTMSAFSIVFVAGSFLSIATLFVSQLAGLHIRPDADVILIASAFGGAIVMGVVDIAIAAKKKRT
jgi:hypothetical protein